MNLPPEGYRMEKRGASIKINNTVVQELIVLRLQVGCSCGTEAIQDINQSTIIDHYRKGEPHIINCCSESCVLEYYVSSDFYHFFILGEPRSSFSP